MYASRKSSPTLNLDEIQGSKKHFGTWLQLVSQTILWGRTIIPTTRRAKKIWGKLKGGGAKVQVTGHRSQVTGHNKKYL